MRGDVAPAILAKSEVEFRVKLHLVERRTSLVHIDVMDGRFVMNRAWADPRVIARLRTPAWFEVHLMVQEPTRAVAAWSRVPRVRRIIIHAESTRDLPALLATVRRTGKGVGIAVNPSTPLRAILPHLRAVDHVLVMANEPGFSGRPFRRGTLRRITALRKRFPRFSIGVDIGVNERTAPLLRHAGATRVAAGSAIFESPDPVAALRRLQRAFRA